MVMITVYYTSYVLFISLCIIVMKSLLLGLASLFALAGISRISSQIKSEVPIPAGTAGFQRGLVGEVWGGVPGDITNIYTYVL